MENKIFKIKLNDEYLSENIIFHINNWMEQHKSDSYIELFSYSSFRCDLIDQRGILGKIKSVTQDATEDGIIFEIERYDYASVVNLNDKVIIYKASYDENNKIEDIIKFLIKDKNE